MNYQTLYVLLQNNIVKYHCKKALFYENEQSEWKGISWLEAGDKINLLARSLITSGINVGDRIGIFSRNMPEWTLSDYAIQAVRAISVPLYSTSSVAQAVHILKETETKFLFVGEQEQYDKALEIARQCSSILQIIVFDSKVMLSGEFPSVYFEQFSHLPHSLNSVNELKTRVVEGNPDDILTIIYTSGTSGQPKGVILTQSNFLCCIKLHQKRLILDDTDKSMCFLPLSHVFERGWTFVVLSSGISNYYLKNPKEIIDKIRVVKPNLMCSVPRFFEKTYSVALSKIVTSSKIKQGIFNWAIKIGEQRAALLNKEEKFPLSFKLKYTIADFLVLKKGRAAFGGHIRYMPCAGASLSEEIVRFFHAAGVLIIYGYGLSETTATISCFPYTNYKFGSVGKYLDGLEVKIGDNDEILVRGGTIMSGYYKNPQATKEVLAANGWFHTGDAGQLDNEGNIFLTDRIKDIFKTSSGKYVAPQLIENMMAASPYIDNIALIGNEKKYVTALIVPAFSALREYAIKNNLGISGSDELVNNHRIKQFYIDIINTIQKDLSAFEQIKKFTLLPNEFSIEGGELTSTLKVKRNVIYEKYACEIAEMYRE